MWDRGKPGVRMMKPFRPSRRSFYLASISVLALVALLARVARPRQNDVASPDSLSSYVAGHIYREDTGQPIPNAVVSLRQTPVGGAFAEPISVVSDAAGAYKFGDLAPGIYTVLSRPTLFTVNVSLEDAPKDANALYLFSIAETGTIQPPAGRGPALSANHFVFGRGDTAITFHVPLGTYTVSIQTALAYPDANGRITGASGSGHTIASVTAQVNGSDVNVEIPFPGADAPPPPPTQ